MKRAADSSCPQVTAYIALGSNLGDRHAHIDDALAQLRLHQGIEVRAVSQLIETEPVGPPGQGPYMNAAAELSTSLPARNLLEVCLSIELTHGRDRRLQPRWGSRTLDIDLLLYGDEVIEEAGLHVPHPRMAERFFVLVPLAQIAPKARHPVLEVTIETLLGRLRERQPEYAGQRLC